MIKKIPVGAPNVFALRPRRDRAPARPQTPVRLCNRPGEMGFVRKMLKEVTGKYHIQAALGERPRGRAILLQKNDFIMQEPPRPRIKIHCISPFALDVINELSVPTTQIKNVVRSADVTREKSTD